MVGPLKGSEMLRKIFTVLLFLTSAWVYAEEAPVSTQVPETVQSMNSAEEPNFSYEELRRFARAFALVKNQYVEPVSDEKLVDAAISGMLNKLDPHSVYLNKEDMIDLQEETEGEFGGLGIEIGEESGYVKIISPIEGTPAARAGVLPGDLIVKINDKSMQGKPMSEVIKLLRGDPGSVVKLSLRRSSSTTPVDLEIKRELIKVKSVRSKLIGDTAYFRITQFQMNTVNDLVTQIRAMKITPKNVVLDLRNDPGGLLNVAVGVVQIFAPDKGTIVTTKARNQVVEEISRYTPENILQSSEVLKDLPDWLHTVPMVVLINVGSASASEIVAGALQDFKRATIMGNRSFGKGSVQVVLPIDDDTGIKLTTARYYTPSGRSIQAKGITPDIVVSDTEKGDLFSFPREVDLDDHLKNDTSTEEEVAVKSEAPAKDNSDKMYEFGSAQDFQLQQAINHLRGMPVNQGVVSKHEEKIDVSLSQEEQNKANAVEQAKEAIKSAPVTPPPPPEKALDKALDKALEQK